MTVNRLKMIAVVGLALVAGAAWGQVEVEWERTFGGWDYDHCNSVIQTADGGFAMVGATESFGAGGRDIWLVRTNASGDSLWSRTFGGENDDWGISLIQTADGGFALAGYTASFGAGGPDFWLVRTSAEGDSLWSITFGGGADERCSMIQTDAGGFALAGTTTSFGVGGQDFWLVLTNAEGDSLWSRTYGSGNNENCYSIIQTAEGGFALAGWTESHEAGIWDFWLIRTNANGDSLWSRSFDGGQRDYCCTIIQTTDGGFALAGWTDSFGPGDADYLLVRTNSDGDSLWSAAYGGRMSELCYSLVQTTDGGFAMGGQTSTFGAGEDDFWLMRTNEDGDSLWSRPFGGESMDMGFSLIQTADAGFTMAGLTWSSNRGNYDFYLVKTTPDPVYVAERPLAPYTLHLEPPFPNPFNSATRIDYSTSGDGNPIRLAVFDPLGKRVAELIPPSSGTLNLRDGRHTVMWDAAGVPAGEYIVRLEAGNQQLAQRLTLVK